MIRNPQPPCTVKLREVVHGIPIGKVNPEKAKFLLQLLGDAFTLCKDVKTDLKFDTDEGNTVLTVNGIEIRRIKKKTKFRCVILAEEGVLGIIQNCNSVEKFSIPWIGLKKELASQKKKFAAEKRQQKQSVG